MASAHFSRREQARFCLVAQAAKARRDLGKSQIDVALDVLGKDGGGANLGDDPLDLGPEVAGIAFPPPLSREAEWLAGIAGREDMNAATPRSAVEGSQIVPDRRWLQGLVFHPGHESGRSMGFPLDETHSAISGLGNADAEVKPCISGAERKAEQFVSAGGMNNHNAILRWLLDWRSEKGSQASIQ